MKALSILIFLLLLISSCSEEEKSAVKKEQSSTTDPKELVQIEGDKYTEYYPDGKNIKFEGHQDENKQRHGKWVYYSEDGRELSMTMYDHGKKHGHSIVKYPNGTINYYGEYRDDKMVGEWKTFDQNGNLIETKDFGYPEK